MNTLIFRFLSALLLTLCCASPLLAQDFASRFTVIKSVEMRVDDSRDPPLNATAWSTLTLPYGGRFGDKSASEKIWWLKFSLDKPATGEPHSLYFYRYNLSIDVFFNGERIGGDSHRENRYTTSWNHPRLINIQNANWKDESNEVYVRFATSYYGGNFSQIVFGETSELTSLWEATQFQRITLNQWLQITGVIVTLFSSLLWLSRRHDKTYLYLAGMAAGWTVLATHMVVYHNLVEYKYWLPLVHFSMHCFSFFYYKLLASLGNIKSPKLDRLITVWLALAALWNQFGVYEIWWMGTYVMHTLGNLFSVYALIVIVRSALTTRDRLSIAISMTVMVQLCLFAHDYLQILSGGNEEWETGTYLTQFAFPLLLVVFAGILLQRFHSALSLAESLNRELESKVEASRQLIEKSYAERRQLELAQATEQERLAIYRNLHDDVGSKLLSIVHAGRDNKLGELARNALESLRNAVSKANSLEQPIVRFLSDVHEEAQLRLEGSGHRFTWSQPEELPDLIVSADTVFNLNQIFRELVSNIIRHARASHVTIALAIQNSAWHIEIHDDGIGFNPSDVPGNGIENINQRVADLGGRIDWSGENQNGALIRLTIPV